MPAGTRVFTGARGAMLRRGNFARRFWRPSWDGAPANADEPVPAILAGFTFHEGRHTQRTWLAEDNIPDIARAARLGQKLPGMADVYEHVTPAMIQDVLAALQNRWVASPRKTQRPSAKPPKRRRPPRASSTSRRSVTPTQGAQPPWRSARQRASTSGVRGPLPGKHSGPRGSRSKISDQQGPAEWTILGLNQ